MEHKRVVRKGDPNSQIATHTLEEGHKFDFSKTRIMTRAANKTGRELPEAWVSDSDSINRPVNIPPYYFAFRAHNQVLAQTRRVSRQGHKTRYQGRAQARHEETA
ncbi:unnamed protein product [Dibothriocephalus latus]|uniref:Uncharacterized protein n=1 Tax=Dibothriocephalus latus TaxID=60516 RepID=A0A3P6TZW3_DIBLA|nr:unnamed protein product [Dibothriocephalus latus]